MAEITSKTLVVSHAAGAAQILSSWIRSKSLNNNFLYCLDGPAIEIFGKKLGKTKIVSLDEIKKLNPKIDHVLTGTGWNSNLERDAIQMAKEHNLKAFAVIDHWKNFRERFLPYEIWNSIPSNWEFYLPDEVWVGDDYAYEHAIEVGIPKVKLRLIENKYFSDFQNVYNFKLKKDDHTSSSEKIKILYITEPIAVQHELVYGDRNYLGYNEFDLIEDLTDTVLKLPKKLQINIRVRLHPSEPANKYNKFIKNRSSFEISGKTDLIDDMIWTDIVVGADSMALVMGILVGKSVFSVIPTGGRKCTLPHQGIIHCKNFMEVFETI